MLVKDTNYISMYTEITYKFTVVPEIIGMLIVTMNHGISLLWSTNMSVTCMVMDI